MSKTQAKIFESKAKLMLSGEYLVLRGALSLALPLKYTQRLTVETGESGSLLTWESRMDEKTWFSATLTLPNFLVRETTSPRISDTLSGILQAAASLNPDFGRQDHSCRVLTDMNFHPDWGFGSSSTLVSNIAWWADCNPFELNNLTFNGSGYDIACARSNGPILYETRSQIPSFSSANFHPTFHKQLYFVYLNRKQNSRTSVRELDLSGIPESTIDVISGITRDMVTAGSLDDFRDLMEAHEAITGRIIRKTPVREALFPDFLGSVKSLGAWGGDFLLAASDAPQEYVRDYFQSRNFNLLFNFSELV